MATRRAWVVVAVWTLHLAVSGRVTAADFAADVAPILKARCLSCHGPELAKGGLRVDSRSRLLRGGDSGEPAVVPGRTAESRLIVAVSGSDPDLVMPPKGPRLTPAEVATLKAWVDAGAMMPVEEPAASKPAELWSLKPLREGPVPATSDAWVANPVDAFVLERLTKAGLEPSPSAGIRTLTRRVRLDVLGLPPDPARVDRDDVPADDREYARLVDEALAHPGYGERWAPHWLDVIRWAETWGYETNLERPRSWPYRDWLVRALNNDLPYDRFIFEQVAGDTVGSDAATALLVAGPANLPGQIGKDEPSMRQARQDELDETVKTVGAAFLGLTVGCARCHDHKFDPISQRDYYSVQAVFAGLHYGPRRLRGPENDAWARAAEDARRDLGALRSQLEARRVALRLKPAVEPAKNTETFSPVVATALRLSIRAVTDGTRPSLYELQAWTAPGDGSPVNVALASNGGRATSSTFALENQTRHPDNLIDGLLADDGRYPWTAREPGPAWVEVAFGKPARIDRVVWQRGFDGQPADYLVEVRHTDGTWHAVADARDRVPHESDRRATDQVQLTGLTRAQVAEVVGLVGRVRAADAELKRLTAGPQVFAGTFGPPEAMYRLNRGDPMQRKEVAAPDVPAVLGSLGLSETSDDDARRVTFARWLTGPGRALTARVIVNRIWQHHFGRGLVDTPSDLGRMGAEPSHPELLDWLAGELIRNGWSLKHVHRLILNSRTYRQASTPRPEALAVDAASRLLWRFPPRRLEAEAIRDAILQAAGTLDRRMYGMGWDFFLQKGGLSDYIPRDGVAPSEWRRMVYATKIRMKPVDVFGAFDCPDAGQMEPRRPRSVTPLQALGLMNSAFVHRQAAAFAETLRREAGADPHAQVRRAFLRALGRPPTPDEAGTLEALATRHGLEQVARVLFNANEFVFLE